MPADRPETCAACSHPPHVGACSRGMGGTAYGCGCLRDTPAPPAPADVGDDDPACTCAPLGKATCVKHAPAPDAGAAERAVVEAAVAYCDSFNWATEKRLIDAVAAYTGVPPLAVRNAAALRGTKGA